MKKAYLLAAAAVSLVAALPASAATLVVLDANGSAPIGASHGSLETTFSDEYDFASGVGNVSSGVISISVTTANYLNLTTAVLNGQSVNFSGPSPFQGGYMYMATVNAPSQQPLNKLFVNGSVVGTGGSYGGNVSFTAGAVPEAATWAMMLVGFGAVGGALRTSRRKVNFA